MSRSRTRISSRRPFTGLAVLAALLATPGLRAQEPQGQAFLQAPIPADPAVLTGELENGLRYYVRANDQPEDRAELRLVVDVGSVLETDEQRGLAHLVEHMAFNGTENFEKQEIVDYLESIGMQFGPSVNAYTSFDETVYMLQVPTDEPAIVETAFSILEDWAHAVAFEPEEVDQERGVVVEEWRLGRGAGARIRDQQIPVMFEGSRYAERLPIGDPEVLETFPHEEIVDFYETWYRPDLMAVVAVGDFDAEAVRDLIVERFGRIPAAEAPLERPSYDVPDRTDTTFVVVTDPEAPASQVSVLTLQDPPPTGTVADYRRQLVEGLAGGMLNARLAELTQRADPPFAAAGSGRGRFVRTKSAYELFALVPEGGHEQGMRALLTEAERAARHGFTPTELERQKLDLMRARERQYAERDNQPSARFAAAYVAHFLTDDPMPSIEFEYQAAQALLPTVELAEVDARARENLAAGPPVVLVTAPEKEGVAVPGDPELRAIFAEVGAAAVDPWEDSAVDEPLVAELPEPGEIVAEDSIPEVGVTVWRLSNGATVWVKPTDFKEDEILFRATSPGGWSRSSLAEHLSASNAATLVGLGGLGAFSSVDLQKALAGKAVGVAASIGQTREGLGGSASPQDLETLLQLVWLRFTAPREDETAFQAFLGQARAQLANRGASPAAAFGDTLSAVMTQHHPRAQPPTVELVDEFDLDQAMAFYRDRFASAEDFTFLFVGALDPEELRPLVERYLAALPAEDRDDRWIDLGIDPPAGVVEKVVRKGIEPQSRTQLVFTGPFTYDPQERLDLRVVASVLELRLRGLLREELGGTYSVNVGAGYEHEPEERYTLQIGFGSDPERADELKAAVLEAIEIFRAEGPTADELQKVLESERRSKETAMQQNGWWIQQLLHAAENGERPGFLVGDERYGQVTAASVREDARRYLDLDRYVSVVLLPEVEG